jgi:hypothetical protein
MAPRGTFGKCPPGVLCITPSLIGIGLLLVAAIGWIVYQAAAKPFGASASGALAAPIRAAEAPAQPISIQIATAQEGGDDRYTRAPKPERHWATEPEMPTRAETYGKLPRMPTRGLPETYQSMGVLTMEDGAVLPLYGRRTASRSDRFQYYTRTDTYNPVQLPLSYKRRDCQDDVGCDELFNGESVKVAATNQTGKATIYRFDGPTYVPGLL